MESFTHNLPVQHTSFVGRESEIAEIVALLDDEYCRLVTLLGPGGIGKTRLALKAAEGLMQAGGEGAACPYPDGLYFVSLQPAASAAQIVSAIIAALDWHPPERGNPTAELLAHLRDKRLLLILDNFEHLVAEAALVQELLHGAPNVKIVVTSREVLNLAEEWLFAVGGMALPAEDAAEGDGDAPPTSDAVTLFVQRAQRVRRHFALAEDQVDVVRICRLVEGMPLAIELAAAWLRSLACAEIAAELQRGLEILHSDQLGIPDRHRAMRVVFDHSWQLLDQDERELLKALSVFQGGFLREAAEAVAGATPTLLAALADKSMLRMTAEGRYSIHELQRQDAAERLAHSGERGVAIRNRHSSYYLHFITHPRQSYFGEESKRLVAAIDAEIGNILAAWYWAVDHDRIGDLYPAIDGLYRFAYLSTHHAEGARAFRYAIDALRHGPADDAHRIACASALESHAVLDIMLGHDRDVAEELLESIALVRDLPTARRELASAIGGLAWSKHIKLESAEAKALFLEAAELNQEIGDFERQAWNYCMLGSASRKQGDYNEVERWYQQALELGRAIGDLRTIADALADLGWLAIRQGEYATARRYLEESLSAARSHGNRDYIVEALGLLGQLAEQTGDFALAAAYLEECVSVARLWGKEPNIAFNLAKLAHLRTGQGDYDAAGELYDEADSLMAQSISLIAPVELRNGMGSLALQTQAYGNARLFFEESLHLAQISGDRLGSAQALVGLGLAALRQDEIADAGHHFLGALQEAAGIGFAPILTESIAAVAELRAAEGDVTYAAQLAALAAGHPAAGAETRQHAATVLAELLPQLSPERRAAITESEIRVDLAAVAGRLIAELSGRGKATVAAGAAPDTPVLIEALSERELQIVRMVAAGKSNRTIGRELYLALGTVKSHLHHIYQKLSVDSRTQAIARAIELDLL
ncbi:MAG: tetratricopeptide repeat protein [Caldilinea sp.]|nr:tetratricopeptide repeat protein [Caldilinea sp.]